MSGKGQFWTPDWIADVMAEYAMKTCLDGGMLDPASGNGALIEAAARYCMRAGISVPLIGVEVDSDVAKTLFPHVSCPYYVSISDFLDLGLELKYSSILVNPPYIRHHLISKEVKNRIGEFFYKHCGFRIDGRAGLQVYFLLKSLLHISEGGRLAFLVSADICEGVFSGKLWDWICGRFRLDCVVTFSPESAVFPDQDTNAMLFLISNLPPVETVKWVVCKKRMLGGMPDPTLPQQMHDCLELVVRDLGEALSTGLSRPRSVSKESTYKLGDFADVVRGVVTGSNDFFFFTKQQADHIGIPKRLLIRAVGRTRDVPGSVLTNEDLDRLDLSGRPTWLLYLNGACPEDIPSNVVEYLRSGVEAGLSEKSVLRTRRPWYKMETRSVPPILFAYLGCRDIRFVRNMSGAVPLTCFLCVYPKRSGADYANRLWSALCDPRIMENMRKVGKSYGGGAVKVEPRALDRVQIPDDLVETFGLSDG